MGDNSCDIHSVPEDEWLEPGEFYVEVEGNRFYYGPECIFDFYPEDYGPEDGWTADEYMDLEGVYKFTELSLICREIFNGKTLNLYSDDRIWGENYLNVIFYDIKSFREEHPSISGRESPVSNNFLSLRKVIYGQSIVKT